MGKTMPFGFPRGYVAQVPAPRTPMTASRVGYSERIDFANGGASIVESAAKHAEYNMSFSGDAQALDGIDVFSQFAAGLYGRGLLHFSDPMNYDVNLLPPAWATPHLCEHGWKAPMIGTPTALNATPTAALPYNRSMRYELTMAPNSVPTHPSKIASVLIPPTHKLWLGFMGVSTGTAAIMVVPILRGGVAAAAIKQTILTSTGGVFVNSSFDGATYQAVEIYVTRTDSSISTLTLRAATAQLHPRGQTAPAIIPRHQAGHGHTGVRFADGAITETYQMTRGHKKQLSTNLIEVGAWV